ncbi:putative homing endonuclease [Vibrio phage 277E43-1]|nr:putative homing endonuclease [Vibrio phage 277E43-1]
MNYEKIYNQLCAIRKLLPLIKEVGYELHHIKPKSLGGSDDNSNLVKLTYREHLLAHKLLTKFNKSPEMEIAYHFMKSVNKVDSVQYNNYRKDRINTLYKSLHDMRNLPEGTATYLPSNCVHKSFKGNLFWKDYLVDITKNCFTSVTPFRLDSVKIFLSSILCQSGNPYIHFQYKYQTKGWRSSVLDFLVHNGLLEQVPSVKLCTTLFKVSSKLKNYYREELDYKVIATLYSYSKNYVKLSKSTFNKSKDFYINFCNDRYIIVPVIQGVIPKTIPEKYIMTPLTLKEIEEVMLKVK